MVSKPASVPLIISATTFTLFPKEPTIHTKTFSLVFEDSNQMLRSTYCAVRDKAGVELPRCSLMNILL